MYGETVDMEYFYVEVDAMGMLSTFEGVCIFWLAMQSWAEQDNNFQSNM